MCKSYLIANVIDCREYHDSGACEIVALNFQGTNILCLLPTWRY